MTFDELAFWDEDRQKWSDRLNDHWCHADYGGSGQWVVMARYGFEDGTRLREFPDRESAEAFYRLFILMLHESRQSALKSKSI